MKTLRIHSFFILCFFFASCSGVKIVNVKNIKTLKKAPIVFSLPKTVLRFEVEATKTIVKKGPFHPYADQLLGIKNAATVDKGSWDITNIKISSFPKADANHTYAIISSRNILPNLISLSNQGMLVGVNVAAAERKSSETDTKESQQGKDKKTVQYSDLTVQKNINEKVDTVFKGKGIDTLFVKIPTLQKQVQQRTIGDQAKEAADQLLKIRKSRYLLMAGKNDEDSEGKETRIFDTHAVEVMANELVKLEEQYLSLFIGHTIQDVYRFTFEYIPSDSTDISRIPLFNFSEQEGVLEANAPKGQIVYLELSETGQNTSLAELANDKMIHNKIKNSFFYRVPEEAQVKVIKGRSQTIASKKMLISQYGYVLPLPVSLLKNKNLKIDFYPETGMLKSIR